MHTSVASLVIHVAILVQEVCAASYTVSQKNVGSDFFTNFVWETYSGTPNGRVEYVSKADAQANNLTYITDDSFVMRADDTTVLTASGTGRKSNRIKSAALYTTHVAVFNIRHMPQGCGTWPALWESDDTVGTAHGEVDIIEGVNDNSPGAVTLHTVGACSMPATRTQLGRVVSANCSSTAQDASGNNGCAVTASDTASFGPEFNENGGGYYAMERTDSTIQVWFWARGDVSVPDDVSSGGSGVNTNDWGTAMASFPDTSCDFGSLFQGNSIIFDLTFCGSYAGARFTADGCSGTCVDYVNSNPSDFSEAYWDIASVYIYE